MLINVKVITSASKNTVEYDEEKNIYKLRVTVIPEKGKANKKIVELLAKHFKVSKSNVEIISGETAREKIIDIKNA